MKQPPRDLAASLHRRLLNGADARGDDKQFITQRYAAERFLYRLGASRHRDQFVLKGAMLFAIWGGSAYRPTRDLDFTGYGDPDIQSVLQRITEICTVTVPDDGMTFDVDTLSVEPIREATEYGGIRVVFKAYLGRVEARMQLDVGFGNAIEPRAVDADYPTLLDAPAPRIRAYPQEAVVAEKLHAMVALGEGNSRYKDFYDLHTLAKHFPFDGNKLTRAIAATFERRRTAIHLDLPVALAARFYADRNRAEQWRAYLVRNALPGAPTDLGAVGDVLEAFLVPAWRALATGESFASVWPVAGPWRPANSTEITTS